jgi:hypothetical protein
MLEEIKKIQGINHNEFDSMINTWIESAKFDLKGIGIVNTLVDEPNSLIQTAIITYVLSFLDVTNSEMYANSYALQKDVLRHTSEYIIEGMLPPEEQSE